MKTIEVEDAVYDFLLKNTIRFGESASHVLRRLLNLSPMPSPVGPSEISGYINSSSFRAKRKAIDKFIGILSQVYEQDPENFKKVLVLKGKKRKYFALSDKELEDSGKNVQPRQIPGSNYWVITNNDTPKKRQMLKDALSGLGYSKQAINEAVNSLV